MRSGKKESINALIGAMAEAESKTFYDDTEVLTSDLKSLLNVFLKKDNSPERMQILKDYEAGAPLTGKGGIRQRLGAIDMEFFGRAYFPHYFSRPSPEFHRELDNIWQQGVLKGEYPITPAKVKQISRMNGTKRVVAAPRGHAKSTMVMRLTEGEASFNSEEQNEPINPEDCIFNPEWFEYYNEAEIDFKSRDYLFFGFVDPSLGKTKKSDFSAIITLAKHKVSGYMYVMDADIERRHPDKIIGDILEKEKMLRRDYGRGYKKFGAETVQFQWFLKEELAKASAKAGLYLPIEEVPQTSDKTMRIQTMQPDIKNHYIKFNKRHKRLLEQMEHFPMGAHDDGVDALEGCRTIAKKTKRFRVLDKGSLGL